MAQTSMPPRTPYEQAIAAIWSDVLGCADVGVHDDFFELGGHSLLAPKVVSRIRKILGVQIPVLEFFACPTVAALASAVAGQSAAGSRVVSRRPADAEPVLSFDQQRLWLENQLLPGAAYNVHGRRRLVGALDLGALQASVRAILVRHEALRTRFPVVDGRPVQLVDDLDPSWQLRVEDLTGIDGDRAGAARRLADEQASTPFDLAQGPLFRCLLIRLGETEHVLAVTMHHIISDAWSVGLFVRELSALYRAGGDVLRTDLPALAVQYRDYAVWQRGRLVGETLQREVTYWREHLSGAPAALTLPAAHWRSVARQSGDRVRVELSKERTAALHEMCRAHGVSPFMALLATLATVLGRWSGQHDVVIGVPIAGRTDAGTDTLIGFFVNTLPIRVDLSGEPTFADVLGRVRRVALDGYAHSEAPVDVLVEQLQVARDPRRTPLFEVILNVIGSPEPEQISGVAVEAMDAPALPSKFDLALNAQESDGTLQLHLDFNADRFEAPMVRVLVAHLQALLCAAVDDPSRGILDYPLEPQPPAAPEALEPAGRPAPDPDRVAVLDADGEWSYRWLDVAAEVLAARVTGSEHVGLVRRPSAAFIAAIVGCARSGVPYSVIEPDNEVPIAYLGISTVLDVAAGAVDLTGMPSSETTRSPAGDWAVDRFGLTGDDRFAVLSDQPALLISAVSSAVAAGATLVLPPTALPAVPGTWMRDNAISVGYLSPPQLRRIDTPLPALRVAVTDNTGELISHDVAALRRQAPQCRIVGVYRVARDGRPLATYEVPEDWRLSSAALRVPLGLPLSGSVTLLNPAGRPAGVGEVAELHSGGSPSGDLVRRWADGTLEFVGELGADLTSDPVETLAALRDVAGVTDAVVTELPDPDGNPSLIGYVSGPDPAQGTASIRQTLVLRLPDRLIPEHIFVLDDLPRTPDGGYDRGALPEPDAGSAARDSYVAPRTPMERRLTELFEELLQVERVGIHDTFFELNGFSLLATQLAARIRDTFHVELSLREVFGSPTVETLAQLILRTQSELSGAEELEALLDEISAAQPESSS